MLSERPDVVRWGDVPLDMTSIVGRFTWSAFNVFYTDPERGMAVENWEVEEATRITVCFPRPRSST